MAPLLGKSKFTTDYKEFLVTTEGGCVCEIERQRKSNYREKVNSMAKYSFINASST